MAGQENWMSPLPEGVTLRVFSGDELIFSSAGKWLMPLFALEDFMQTYQGPRDALSAHDTAVGKAAAVIMVRLGITRINANVGSVIAETYISELNRNSSGTRIEFTAVKKVPELMCSTEKQLGPMNDGDEMYRILRQRAKLVRGVDVVVEHLSCSYCSLHDLSFTVPAGGNLLVVGENGTGKTTLLRFLTGNLRPDSGLIRIDGKNPRALLPRTVCYVPQEQDSARFPLSVEEVVGLGIRKKTHGARELVHLAMERTGCAALRGRSYASLSGGEKQKVAVARCLAQEAKVLLLDEPTSALDENARSMVAGFLHALSVREIPTIITVTHDRELVKELGWQALTLGDAA
jgi:ABC-type cobalamin/Fe3+-siderophores transport systems, ATPase components